MPTAAPAIRNVIFDFGNVVVEWSMPALFRQYFETEDAMAEFLSTVLTPEQNLRCDLSEPLAEIVADLVAQHPHHREPLEAWRDNWMGTLPRAIDGTEELIDDLLAAGYGVYGLSNFSAETFPWAVERYPVFNKFHGVVLSGNLGIAKPAPEIYHALAKEFGIDLAESVFMDDSLPNIEGAEQVGLPAFHFTSAADARRRLIEEFHLEF